MLLVEGPDRFRRVLERRVVGVDARQRQHRRDRALHAALEEHVADRDLQEVADLPLALGSADIERHGVHPPGRGLLLEEDTADLRAVAVRDDDLPARGRDVGDPLRSGPRGAVHLLERVLLPLAEELRGLPPRPGHRPGRRERRDCHHNQDERPRPHLDPPDSASGFARPCTMW